MADLWFVREGNGATLAELYALQHPGEDVPEHVAKMLAELDRKTAVAEERTEER